MPTSNYVTEWTGALADLTAAGVLVTFTSVTGGVYDPATDTTTGGGATTVTGAAMRVRGNPIRYAALDLKLTEAATLLFAPSTIDVLPPLGATVPWDSITYVVKDVDPIEPDGEAILARITIAR